MIWLAINRMVDWAVPRHCLRRLIRTVPAISDRSASLRLLPGPLEGLYEDLGVVGEIRVCCSSLRMPPDGTALFSRTGNVRDHQELIAYIAVPTERRGFANQTASYLSVSAFRARNGY